MARESTPALVVPREASLATMLATFETEPPIEPHDWVERIEASLGHAMSEELRVFVSWAGNRTDEVAIGCVNVQSEWPAAVADPQQWLSGMMQTTIAPLVEAFSDTVHIGIDGAGNMYFASAAPDGSEVFY